jgi:hypothetical protein
MFWQVRIRTTKLASITTIFLLINCSTVNAQPTEVLIPISTCVRDAAAFHKVNNLILQAIIFHESRNNPALVLKNSNGSIDVGLGGLNSIHFNELSQFGIRPGDLLNGCVNTFVTAWLLAKQVKKHGNTWLAVGSYHSTTPLFRDRYAGYIYTILRDWQTIPNLQLQSN